MTRPPIADVGKRAGLGGGALLPRAPLRFGPLALLSAQNVVVFWRHYFRGYGFPWDFLGSYYAIVAYWSSAVRSGVFPQWVPYQSMGYPIAVNLQSSLFYPPLWIFPLLRVGYSMHRAVVLQCLHVLVGALGAYALLRRVGRSRLEATIGAFAFQFFGGFYSNAEHPDIVRGDALAPWLLWALTLPHPSRLRLASRNLLFAPLVVFLLATGGYPGILLSSLSVACVWVAIQSVEQINRRGPPRAVIRPVLICGALLALGLVMAAVHLAPAWLHRADLVRYRDWAERESIGLGLADLPGLFLPNASLPGNASMTSTYLPIPILLAAFWAPLRRRRNLAALGVLATSLLMVPGPASPVFRLVRAIVPPLGYSRLPAADYRVFVALSLVLLGTAGLRALRRAAVFRSWRLPIALLLFGWGWLQVFPHPAQSRDALAALACLAGALAVLLFVSKSRRTLVAGAALVALMSLDAPRVLGRMQHLDGGLWRLPDVEAACRRRFPDAFPQGFDGVVPRTLFETRPGARGPRHMAPPGSYRAAGYLRGDLLVSDYGGTVLSARRKIEETPALHDFMLREWTPVLLPPESRSLPQTIRSGGFAAGRVLQTAYGNERADYELDLERPALFVENEIYFPGWEATLGSGTETRSVQAIPVDGSLRAWPLPAGRYRMTARFRFPNLGALTLASAGAWIVWAISLASALRRDRRRRRRDGVG